MTAKSKPVGILDLVLRLWQHISLRRRNQFLLLFGLMILSAFTEMISLGAVIPFLGTLLAPDRFYNHPVVAAFAQSWGITSANQLLLPLTIAFVIAALVAGAFRLLLLWASSRLAFASGDDLSIEVYRRTLYQPFIVHVLRNSSELISGITRKIEAVTFGVLLPAMTLVSSAVLMIAIMIVLLVIDAVVAGMVALSFGTIYGLITWLFRFQVKRSSKRIAKEQTRVVQALQEGLGGIRDVLLNGVQPLYCDLYRQANRPLWKSQHTISFLSGSPKFAIEALAIVLIVILAYLLSRKPEGISAVLPVLGALALGAQRLLPALQQSYSSWSSIVGNHASLSDVLALLDQPIPSSVSMFEPSPLMFQGSIRFDEVRFRYSSDGPWVLDHVNFTIRRGSRVGLIGLTGSGKSTVLDLLMGLLDPSQGQILVDDQPIVGIRRRAWQQNIAHVPQKIYLADTSIAENIAFGVKLEAIDMNRVRQAALQAQIAEFIESQVQGYQTYFGERGIRLSGGQLQRIGIARALYKQADVLVLDEATSALDNATEKAVLDVIDNLNRDITIVIIAHRLTTVQRCDSIIELKNGRISIYGQTSDVIYEK